MNYKSLKYPYGIGRELFFGKSIRKRLIYNIIYFVGNSKIKSTMFLKKRSFYSLKESQLFHDRLLDQRMNSRVKSNVSQLLI